MRRLLWTILWRLAVPLAALFAAIVGAALPWAIFYPSANFLVFGFLSALIGTLLAALSAAWVGNLASHNQTRGRLFAVLAASYIGTAVAVIIGALGLVAVPWLFPVLTIGFGLMTVVAVCAVLAVCALVFFGSIAFSTWRLGEERAGGLGLDGAAAITISVVWVAMLFSADGPGYYGPGRGLGLVPPGFLTPPGFSADLTLAGGIVGVGLMLTALGVVLAVRRSRRSLSDRGLGRDAAITLVLIGLVPAVMEGGVYLGCRVLSCPSGF